MHRPSMSRLTRHSGHYRTFHEKVSSQVSGSNSFRIDRILVKLSLFYITILVIKIMKVYPSEATPPKNWAPFKKEPLSFIKSIILGLWFIVGFSIITIALLIAIALVGISLFELTTVLFYEWTH